MSAIFGVYHPERPVDIPDYLAKIDGALAPHGPDGGGVRINNAMGVGQRLMCFTPEDRLEVQPLLDGPLTLVADARIDNRPELAQVFGLSAREAAEMPDSAFILRAFQKWGDECGSHLVGDWACAIWDAGRQRLFAARSPLGGRMLFYYQAGPVFAFATVPRGLLALPFVPRLLDEEKVAGSLVGAARDPQATFFKGITRMLPGHFLTFDQSGLNVRPYWQPDLEREIRFKKDEDYVEAFLELYERVIRDHLRSLTPVGISLSGGLDSASLAAMAALIQKPTGERIASFIEVPRLGFDGPTPKGYYADETPFVQAIAERYPNLDLHFTRTTDKGLLDGVETLFDYASMPLKNVSNRVWCEAIYQQAKEQGNRVLLTGEQGNLTISWEGSGLIQELVRGGKWKQAMAEAKASVHKGDAHSMGRVLVGQGLLPFFSPRVINALSRMRQGDLSSEVDLSYSPIRPEFARAHNVADSVKAAQKRENYQDRTQMRLSRYQILVKPDMAGTLNASYRAMYGVDTRLPLGDLRLVEFCLSLPEEQQRRNGQARWLIRRAMAPRLPQKIVQNQMRGMQAADWFARFRDSRAAILDDLKAMELSELASQFLDVPRLRHIVEDWPQGDNGSMRMLYAYRTLETGLMMGRFLRWFEVGAGA